MLDYYRDIRTYGKREDIYREARARGVLFFRYDPDRKPVVKADGELVAVIFNDPILDMLVATALAENLSLRSAGLRVLQARQQLLIAIGSIPRIVVLAVIKTGLILSEPACTIALNFSIPDCLNWFIWSISTIPLLTTIPARIIPPTKLAIDSVVPVIASITNTPTIARGIVNITIKGCLNDSNCEAMTV